MIKNYKMLKNKLLVITIVSVFIITGAILIIKNTNNDVVLNEPVNLCYNNRLLTEYDNTSLSIKVYCTDGTILLCDLSNQVFNEKTKCSLYKAGV